MNLPKQTSSCKALNHHARFRQPKGYYAQVITDPNSTTPCAETPSPTSPAIASRRSSDNPFPWDPDYADSLTDDEFYAWLERRHLAAYNLGS